MRRFCQCLAILFLLACANQVRAAGCSCTQNGLSTTKTQAYHSLNCSTSATACSVTDGMFSTQYQVSLARHLELENDCAAVVTVCAAGDTAVLHHCWDIQPAQQKFYDVLTGPVSTAPPGTVTGTGFVPPGPYSVISAGAQNACFNFYVY